MISYVDYDDNRERNTGRQYFSRVANKLLDPVAGFNRQLQHHRNSDDFRASASNVLDNP